MQSAKIYTLLSYLGVQNPPLFLLRISVCLLFSLLPFRILGIIGFQFYLRLFVGFLIGAIIYWQSSFIIPRLLDTKFFQLIFYFNLCCDEKLKGFDYIFRVPIFLGFFGSLIYLFFFGDNTQSICLSCLFYWSFYRSLKAYLKKKLIVKKKI